MERSIDTVRYDNSSAGLSYNQNSPELRIAKKSTPTALSANLESSSTSVLANERPTPRVRIADSSTPSARPLEINPEAAKKFRIGLEKCLASDSVESGMKSAAEYYVEKWLLTDPILVQIELSKVWLNSLREPTKIVGLLHMIAHADRKALSPNNQVITLASLSHESAEVKEFAISVYETWGDPKLVEQLKTFQMHPKWLDDYRKEVIAEFCGDQ